MSFSQAVHASVTATAELNYMDYDASNAAGIHLSGSTLSQHYSLLVSEQGKIINERLGVYNVSLGYDWAAFDSSVHSTAGGNEDLNVSRGHFLFQGDVLVNPKELPFKLHVYSRDMNRINFENEDHFRDPRFIGDSAKGRALQISPNFVTGIQDGTHIESGATLLMGVKNGMTNGYSDFLRHFPMLMLDYKDVINRDLNSVTAVDNRLTRLAFVSLNKKDNWFHYRLINYFDYIAPENNYSETQFQLGTVDQVLQRRWIDFANWISVSVDGQLTKHESPIFGGEHYTEFELNLFGVARRATWELSTFNNFDRRRDSSGLVTYRTTVPVFLNGSMGPNTNWSARFALSNVSDNRSGEFKDISVGYRVDTFKQALFTLSQSMSLESASAESGKSLLSLGGTVETTSTPRFSREYSVGSSYSATTYTSKERSAENFMFDQLLKLSANYTPAPTLRIAFSEQNRLSRGQTLLLTTSVLDTTVQTPQNNNPRGFNNGSFFQSLSNVYVTWRPDARISVDMNSTLDLYTPDNGVRSTKYFSNVQATYTGPQFKASSSLQFTSDDTDPKKVSKIISSNSRVEYLHSRNLDASLAVMADRDLGNNGSTTSLTFLESLNYNVYKVNGVVRKIIEFHQSARYYESSFDPLTAAQTKETTLTLGTKYYPFRQLTLAAGGSYKFYSNFNNYELSYFGQSAVAFKLFQASLDYSYGKRKADGLIEKKLTANFRKTF